MKNFAIILIFITLFIGCEKPQRDLSAKIIKKDISNLTLDDFIIMYDREKSKITTLQRKEWNEKVSKKRIGPWSGEIINIDKHYMGVRIKTNLRKSGYFGVFLYDYKPKNQATRLLRGDKIFFHGIPVMDSERISMSRLLGNEIKYFKFNNSNWYQ